MDINSKILEMLKVNDEAIDYFMKSESINYNVLEVFIESINKIIEVLSKNEIFNDVQEEINLELKKMAELIEIQDLKMFCDLYKYRIKELILECIE